VPTLVPITDADGAKSPDDVVMPHLSLGTPAIVARDAAIRIARAHLEPHELFYEISSRIRHVVPYDAAGWMTLDPDSLLAGGTLETNKSPALVRAMWRNELQHTDVNTLSQLARRRVPVAALSELDAASAAESRRAQVILLAAGIGDELRVMLRANGVVWGHFAIYRERGSRDFSSAERRFVADIANDVTLGLRRSLARPPAPDRGSIAQGVVTLGPDGRITAKTAEAARTMALMPGDAAATLYAVAIGARQHEAARARVRLTDGRWAVLYAAPMIAPGDASNEIAVTVAPPSQPELASLLLRLHGVTKRERQVAELVMQRLTTEEIAARLHISHFTVRDHVKAVFAKTGARSRAELTALGSGR
jgi:DNA-binding CsgD family transcriptional regulator